jgi:hypothetical protein
MRNPNLFICPREQGNLSVYASRYLFVFFLPDKLMTFLNLQVVDLFSPVLFLKASTQNLRVAIGSSQVIAWTNQKKEKKANEEVKKGGSQLFLSEIFSSSHPQLELSRAGSTTSAFISHPTQLHHRSRFGHNYFQYC